MSAHPALAKMGQLALMVLTATLVRAPPGLEGRTARRVSDGVGRGGGGMVLAIKGMELYF